MKRKLILTGLLVVNSLFLSAQVGSIDPTFNVGTGFGPDQWTGKCEVIVQQTDGKLLVGGSYETFNEAASIYLTQLNLDGSRDASFTSPFQTGWGNTVSDIQLQPDGKIVVAGNFSLTGSTVDIGMVRLNADGSVDPTFTAPATIQNVSTFAIQADGKFVLGNLMRLNADGSLDATFDAGSGIAGTTGFGSVRVNKVAIQPDGKILIGGHFATYNGISSILLARLNTDGSLDNTFNANANFSAYASGFYGQVYTLKVLPDGKIMMGGNYGNSNSLANGVDRINADGTLDNSFQVTHSTDLRNYAMDVQADGKVLAANVNFGAPSEAFVIERYTTAGALDAVFTQDYVNNDVKDLIVQSDGNITFVGYFNYNPIGIKRLIGDTPLAIDEQVSFDFNVYPNPSQGVFTIDTPVNASLDILNAQGKVIYSGTAAQGSTQHDVSNLAKGVYTVRMTTEYGMDFKQLVLN